jgi:hypothetical protein
MTTWRNYEEVAQHLLNEFAEHFHLSQVEGKQHVVGASGTRWEIDAKAVLVDDSGFIVVECRRHTRKGVSQEQVAGLAYRIKDTGAHGGIVVSPLDLQIGAKIVAAHEGIRHMRLDENSTTAEYIFSLMDKAFLKRNDEAKIGLKEHVRITEIDPTNGSQQRVVYDSNKGES